MRYVVILSALIVAGLLSSCQQKKNKAALTTQKVEVAEPVIESAPKEEVKPVKQMNYYVVAGCFEFKENAERLNAKLIEEGFDSKILPFYHLNMVTYNGYENREEAQVALNKLVLEPDKECVWVYPLK